MSLIIDVYDEGEWSTLREITPKNGLVPMQSVENGRPVLYALECSEDDSRSTMYRLPVEIEMKKGERLAIDKSCLETVREVGKGEEAQLLFYHPSSPHPLQIRFKHE